MTEERYVVFKKSNRLWGVDTLLLSGVVAEPSIEEIPFVPSVIDGLIFLNNEVIPVINIGGGDEFCNMLIVIDSIYGKLGIKVKEIVGIFRKEEIVPPEEMTSGTEGVIIGELKGERIFYFDLKIINEFFKNIEIKN